MNIIIKYYKSPFGELIIGSYGEFLCLSDWKYRKMRNSIDNRIKTGLKSDFILGTSVLIENAIDELEKYFQYKLSEFSIPLLLVGTEFQKKVWKALQNIKYGEISTYSELSKSIGMESAVRAVANANGANALSIFVPCHRIIGTNNELVGYAGGLDTKKKLLNLEKSQKEQNLLF